MVAQVERVETEATRDDGGPESGRWLRLAKPVLLAAGIALVLLFWWWCSDAESRAIRAMPSSERQALLSRTLENLRSVCQAPEDGMREFCETQAQLALKIPECDGRCQALVQAQLAHVRMPR
jgi:hypothetical protein